MDHNENSVEKTPSPEAQPSEINLCVNMCGFFGNPQTANMCSKCYRDLVHKAKTSDTQDVDTDAMPETPQAAPSSKVESEEVEDAEMTDDLMIGSSRTTSSTDACASSTCASSSSGMDAPTEPTRPMKQIQMKKNRCWSCNKKVGLLGHECRCKYVFCGLHRYAEDHNCMYDFKENGRKHLAEQNPHVIAPKIQKI